MYYQATAGEELNGPPLQRDVQADVVVIGGGLTGISAAYHLARAGCTVVVLEAETLGAGASGRNGGQLIPGFRLDWQAQARRHGLAGAQALYRLGLEARDLVWSLADDCDLTPGHLHACVTPRDFAATSAEVAFIRDRLGFDHLDLVARDALPQHVTGGGYAGAVYDRLGGHFHPLKFLRSLARKAQAAGAFLHEGSRVLALEQAGPSVVARTTAGTVRAKAGLLACDALIGALSPHLAGAIMPVASYCIATEPLPFELADTLLPGRAAVADSRFALDYYRLSADNRLLFSGGETYTQVPRRDVAAFVRPHMLGVFPALDQARIDYAWSGLVGITRNRLPQVGHIRGPGSAPLYFAHGYSGQGCLLAPYYGKGIADHLCGDSRVYDQLAALPAPRWPGGRMLRGPLYTAGMLYYALRDRLER